MSLSGRYTTLDSVLDRITLNSGLQISEQDAAEWIADLLTVLAPYDTLYTIVTDGNQGNPQPVQITNYRGELPCDIVQLGHIIDLETFIQLRDSRSPQKLINFSNNAEFKEFSKYLPSSAGSKDSYTIRNGFIFTDFEEGHLILIYQAWPRDEYGNFLIPADRPFLEAFTWHIQEKIDYFLWRSGEIADKVYQTTNQKALWAKGHAVSYAENLTDGQQFTATNIWSTPFSGSHHFRTAYRSLGRQIVERIH